MSVSVVGAAAHRVKMLGPMFGLSGFRPETAQMGVNKHRN